MTPGELPQFASGKNYNMYLVEADGSQEPPIVRAFDSRTKKTYTVEVEGDLLYPIEELKSKFKSLDLVCTAVMEGGPEFELPAKYFKQHPAAGNRRRKGANIGLQEGLTVEFKQSLVFSPVSQQPNSDQPFNIAKEVAAFMNSQGGELYLGVDDNGFVTGIEGDLPYLGKARIMSNAVTDTGWTYRDNIDSFKRKLGNAILAYLGQEAMHLVKMEVLQDTISRLHYVKVAVEASSEPVYLGREESVVYRAESSVVCLKGRSREAYVKIRFYDTPEMLIIQGMSGIVKAFEAYKAELAEKVAEELANFQQFLARGPAA